LRANAVELVERGIADHDSSRAFASCFNSYACAQALREIFLEASEIAVRVPSLGLTISTCAIALRHLNEALGIAYRQSLGDDFRRSERLLRRLQREQGPGVPHIDVSAQ